MWLWVSDTRHAWQLTVGIMHKGHDVPCAAASMRGASLWTKAVLFFRQQHNVAAVGCTLRWDSGALDR